MKGPEGKNSMPELKLSKLPDRMPVKITVTLPPELNHALRQYAGIYRATYGEAESVADLIPFMLTGFLESDRGFSKARKDTTVDTAGLLTDQVGQPRRRVRAAVSSPITSTEG
jgi:hypothetical protein